MPRYFLDLFAGIGGFRLGAEWAGLQFDGEYFSEVDPYAIKVYSRRFPESVALGDIRNIRGTNLPEGEWIIAGGFPCQDISVAGKGAGLQGARSGLWYEYARIIGELRPRFAIMENVGVLAFRGLDSVLGSLAALGYDAEWQDIRASDVGAPHRRERIWIVAYPDAMHGAGSPESREQLERPAQSPRSGADGVESGDDVADTPPIGCGTGRKGRPNPSGTRQPEQPLQALADSEQNRRGFFGHENGDLPSENRQKTNIDSDSGASATWWATEPDMGRVAHGIPSRVDRLKCLGNSIVPQIAELIFFSPVFDDFRRLALDGDGRAR
jgi:DNA (cytosine-5)-methyltransferase 1